MDRDRPLVPTLTFFFLIEFTAGDFSILNVVSHRCFHSSYDI